MGSKTKIISEMKMKKLLLYFLVLIYVFIIPIYYEHCKERRIKRCGITNWNSSTEKECYVMSVMWPFALLVEITVDWQEFREWKNK